MCWSKRTGDERSEVAHSGGDGNEGPPNSGGKTSGPAVPDVFSPESEALNCERILGDRRHGLEPDDEAT